MIPKPAANDSLTSGASRARTANESLPFEGRALELLTDAARRLGHPGVQTVSQFMRFVARESHAKDERFAKVSQLQSLLDLYVDKLHNEGDPMLDDAGRLRRALRAASYAANGRVPVVDGATALTAVLGLAPAAVSASAAKAAQLATKSAHNMLENIDILRAMRQVSAERKAGQCIDALRKAAAKLSEPHGISGPAAALLERRRLDELVLCVRRAASGISEYATVMGGKVARAQMSRLELNEKLGGFGRTASEVLTRVEAHRAQSELAEVMRERLDELMRELEQFIEKVKAMLSRLFGQKPTAGNSPVIDHRERLASRAPSPA